MRNNSQTYNQGFTLIETLIYISLFAFIIVAGLIGVYQVISSTNQTSTKTLLEQDANFILRKIESSLNEATALTTPFPQPRLVIQKTPSNVVYDLNGTDIRQDGTILNSSWTQITDLSFQLIATGARQGVTTTFTAIKIDNTASQTFTSTKYLR